ncbi:MFS transporter [Leifsonia poae]|uniref:MFS transporter n=1 Tax=Leifsonia poae TaxID=110933 RepID=UPI003D67688C
MRRWVVTVLCLVQFVDVLGVTSATTAIPAIIDGLNLDEAAAGPIATMYAMFFGGFLVLGARLGDRYGHRRILLAGIVMFALVSIVGGTATGLAQLLIARAAQGAAAAISVPSALRLLLHASPEGRARTTALAAWSAVGAAAGASGFLVGGVLAQSLGWQAVFWVNAPVGALLAAGILSVIPVLPPQKRTGSLDAFGAVLLIGAVMAIVFGCSLLESASTRALGVAGIVAGALIGAGFVVRQRLAADPLIPLDAFRSSNIRVGTLVSFVNTAATSSSAVIATLFLQGQLDASPIAAGLTLMALSIAVIVASSLVRTLSRWLDSRRLAIAGLGIIAGGNIVLACTYGTWWGITVGVGIAGFGLGLASVGATSIGTDVSDSLAGSASGILNTGAQIGTALGTALLVVVASFDLGRIPGTALAWSIAALGALATALSLTVTLLRRQVVRSRR